MSGRVCYVVVKNGKIVHERYMGSGSVDGIRSAWSATKSMCASMFGIAVEQGWADVNDLVRSRNEGTRQCSADAEFRHVLTMTGTSPDMSSPRYSCKRSHSLCVFSRFRFSRLSSSLEPREALHRRHAGLHLPRHATRLCGGEQSRRALYGRLDAALLLRQARRRALALAAPSGRPALRLLRRHLLPRPGALRAALGERGFVARGGRRAGAADGAGVLDRGAVLGLPQLGSRLRLHAAALLQRPGW